MIAGMFFLSLGSDDPGGILDRYAAFIDSPSLKVEIKADALGGAWNGKGLLTISRADKMLFRFKSAASEYTYVVTSAGGMEMESALQVYSDQPAYHQLQPPLSTLSQTPDLSFPEAVLMDIRKIYPGVKLKSLGKREIRGMSVDVVEGDASNEIQQVKMRLFVAASGELARIENHTESGGQARDVSIDLSGYERGKPVAPETFSFHVPSGYSANRLPLDPSPLEPGAKLPDLGLSGAKGSTMLSQVRPNKPCMVAILDENCEPSRAAAGMLKSLVDGANLPFIAVRATGSAPTPSGVESYVSEADLRQSFRLPGTPYFYLLDAAGTIQYAWFGFNPAKLGTFKEEVSRAAQQLSATRD